MFKSGSDHAKARLYIGHDGTMIRFAAALGIGKLTPLRWPALGSEIIMEVTSLCTCCLISESDDFATFTGVAHKEKWGLCEGYA